MTHRKKRTYYSVDCEVDGPAAPLRGSMFWFGAVRIDHKLRTTFDGELSPVSDYYEEARLKISGLTRADTLLFPKPEIVMPQFAQWVLNTCDGNQPELVSDNNGFDFGLINLYLWQYASHNPFGHTSRNINDLYKGLEGDIRSSFKHLVKTPHTHNPVDDAVGHAEAFLAIAPRLKIKI
ncbi:exonuclease [Patescibacteria group bacterium]|nr:exonuclease [Patescibacteria group bacterium]